MKKFLEKLKKLEPLFRLIEVVFIGVLSVAVAINANIIADKANTIAENQLISEQMEAQPHFVVGIEDTSNSADKEFEEKITVRLKDGIAENISTEAVTCWSVFRCLDVHVDSTTSCDYTPGESVKINLNDYLIPYSSINNPGAIDGFVYNEDFEKKISETHDTLRVGKSYDSNENVWSYDYDIIIKISYTDYMGNYRNQYYSAWGDYYGEEKGKKLYDEYMNLENSSYVDGISDEYVESLLEAAEKE